MAPAAAVTAPIRAAKRGRAGPLIRSPIPAVLDTLISSAVPMAIALRFRLVPLPHALATSFDEALLAFLRHATAVSLHESLAAPCGRWRNPRHRARGKRF